MMKTDFMHRTVTLDGETFHDCDGGKQKVVVMRTRTTAGYAAIKVQFGKQTIEFNSDLGDNYEQAARNMVELLDEICSEPCTIPTVTP